MAHSGRNRQLRGASQRRSGPTTIRHNPDIEPLYFRRLRAECQVMIAFADGPDAPPTPASEPGATAATPEVTFAPDWQRTLFLMMGIQLGMNMGLTVLSPVMPLFLPQLGVRDPAAIGLWAGVLSAVTPLVAAFASPL